MSSIAIVRARLPYTDQRSLSEAWFSALHLARQREGDTSFKRGAGTGRSRSSQSPPERVMRERRREVSRALPGWQSEAVVETGPSQRREFAPVSATSRRRALSRALQCRAAERQPPTNNARASFGVALDGGGRVQIILRREGRVLHVVALCSARHLELVRRALACADLHLRLSGERVSSSVRVR